MTTIKKGMYYMQVFHIVIPSYSLPNKLYTLFFGKTLTGILA